ncbi:MAG: endonuclease domain-containing protein [Chloroflexi bacterium]|nr:endonuclease domain-containing protein [Chloroflexota bacterium]
MPVQRTKPTGYKRARALRKELTPAERKLWACLRGNKLMGSSFRRQHAIGKYIADFCSIKDKLVIELDGSQHLEQEEYDEERTEYFRSKGYKVLRFWNHQVMNDIEGVIKMTLLILENPPQKSS